MKRLSPVILLAALLQSGTILIVPAVALTAASSPAWTATQAAAPAKVPDWLAGVRAAGKVASAGRYRDAIAILQNVDRFGSVPPDMALEVHGNIVRYAIKAKDYATAAGMNERILTAKEDSFYSALEDCVLIAMLQNRTDRARECARRWETQ